jgi:hypothetical protein
MQIVTERVDGVFPGQRRVAVYFDKDVDKVTGPSRNRVKPEFLRETKIDVIIERATRTGLVPTKPFPGYRNVTGTDFLTMQNAIIDVQKYFDSLPSDTREFFANSPVNYLDFIADPKNKDQAIELGLIEKPAPAPVEPAPDVPPVAPVAPVVPPTA